MASENYEIALKRIREAKKNHLRYLDLSFLELVEIPHEIRELNFLMDLDLSYNNLNILSDEIYSLDNLHYLNISNNNLSDLNFMLGRAYSFKEINISNNQFNFIPSSLLKIGVSHILYENNLFLTIYLTN
ncbi:hypothetical protein [Flagellimonas meridianipacifica]|uniref:Leucine rich repeat (LRR) protein n=1 Tax=Flagellimonas meridianipacifica TaxID=1080225 RepID=A0A2T0MFR6_9FLAO|nr:hypothetical protein [Allomuricauda pacifica]PRX56376.1 leucine rich repeat (LRR) protein [Allomuricauda pacifica]